MGYEIPQTRPAVIVTPEELNAHLSTVLVVPLTTGRSYPFRISTKVPGKDGLAAIDPIRTVDKQRLVKWRAHGLLNPQAAWRSAKL